jgi:cobalt-zinc-cadmium resistance protein CzcA
LTVSSPPAASGAASSGWSAVRHRLRRLQLEAAALEAYPDIADVTSQIVTQVPGLGAEEIEQQITIPLERALLARPACTCCARAACSRLSLITVVFEDGSDGYWARQRLQERMASVNLPYGAKPGSIPTPRPRVRSTATPWNRNRSLRELSELQFWVVIPRLKQVRGVVDVSNFGGLTTQFMLELDPARLAVRLTLAQVIEAINANNASGGGSVIDRGEQSYVVRGVGLLHSLDDMGNVVVSSKNGVPVLVKDLGRLAYGNVERRGILGKDDNPDTIEGIVLLLKDFNPSEALAGIHAAVDELNGNLLPPDVKVVPYLDRTTLIDATLHTVGRRWAKACCSSPWCCCCSWAARARRHRGADDPAGAADRLHLHAPL